MWILELTISLTITYFFIKKEKPKIKFLFYGYFFLLISLILQIPLKLIIINFQDYFQNNLIPLTIINLIITLISPITKYLSIKKFIKTKSYKNGILFGIGWATFESINLFKEVFLPLFLNLFSLEININLFLNTQLTTLHFLFFFITNLAITILIIISIIKKKKNYLIAAIISNISIFFGTIILINTTYKIIFYTTFTLGALTIIFHYRKIKQLK